MSYCQTCLEESREELLDKVAGLEAKVRRLENHVMANDRIINELEELRKRFAASNAALPDKRPADSAKLGLESRQN